MNSLMEHSVWAIAFGLMKMQLFQLLFQWTTGLQHWTGSQFSVIAFGAAQDHSPTAYTQGRWPEQGTRWGEYVPKKHKSTVDLNSTLHLSLLAKALKVCSYNKNWSRNYTLLHFTRKEQPGSRNCSCIFSTYIWNLFREHRKWRPSNLVQTYIFLFFLHLFLLFGVNHNTLLWEPS